MFKFFNKLVSKLKWFDVKVIGGVGLVIGAGLVKLIPSLADINLWWYVGAVVLGYAWIVCRMFRKTK